VLLAGTAAAWGALGNRVRVLEKAAAENTALATAVANLDAKVELIRKDQGVRIGEIKAKTDGLAGTFAGFQTGFATGRRSRTAAAGVPLPRPEGED
jgi:tetrahydromethanopterin S-methyltransferase subunit F